MTLSTSRLAYLDAFKLLDAALEDRQGVRFEMPTHDSAVYFRMRIHMARKIDRQDNAQTYDEGHPLYGRSQYDRLTIRVKTEEGKVYLYLEKTLINIGTAEPLAGEVDEEFLLEDKRIQALPRPTLQIEYEPSKPEPITVKFRRL